MSKPVKVPQMLQHYLRDGDDDRDVPVDGQQDNTHTNDIHRRANQGRSQQ